MNKNLKIGRHYSRTLRFCLNTTSSKLLHNKFHNTYIPIYDSDSWDLLYKLFRRKNGYKDEEDDGDCRSFVHIFLLRENIYLISCMKLKI